MDWIRVKGRKVACAAVASEPCGVEAVSAGMALAFALVWLWPGSSFDRSPAYRQLSEMLPESIWGLIWLAASVGQFGGLLGWRWRPAADLTMAALWAFWAASAYLSTGWTTVQPSYGWLALCSLWAARPR